MVRKRKRGIDEEGQGYKYKELSIPRNEIRLLNLQPGLFNDEIQCTLQNVSLDENPEYHALSYTWGNPVNAKSVFIDGCIFNITVNLYDALQNFRDQSDLRTFWIDALCINQQNVSERSKQVLRMRDIYSQADRVEVWIGLADEDDYAALELVQHLGDAVPNPEELLTGPWMISYHDLFMPLFQDCTAELLKALNCLYRRPWWTRVWVVQEVSLANQPRARVTCGRKSLPWVNFLITSYAIDVCWLEINTIIWDEFPDEPLDSFLHGTRFSQCRRIRDSDPPFTLLELLNQHRDCVATDPRDYVYGLLGMSGDGQKMGIEADYNSSPQMIYSDLVVKYVNATGSLDILCACRNQRNFNDLPSWVPDWSTDTLVPGICLNQRYCGGDDFPGSPLSQAEKYHSGGASRARFQFSEDGLHLTAAGFTFGHIIEMGVVDDGMKFEVVESFGRTDENGKSGSDSDIFNNWLNLLLDSQNWKDIEHTYGSPQNVLDAFCRILVAGRDSKWRRLSDVSDHASEESSPVQVKTNDSSGESGDQDSEELETEEEEHSDNRDIVIASGESSSTSDFTECLFSPAEMLNMTTDTFRSRLEVCWGKRMAVLDSGFIGIVPGESEKGDMVYVFIGCSLPLIVRKGEPSHHTLVGESYFYGATEGELVHEHQEIFERIIFA